MAKPKPVWVPGFTVVSATYGGVTVPLGIISAESPTAENFAALTEPFERKHEAVKAA